MLAGDSLFIMIITKKCSAILNKSCWIWQGMECDVVFAFSKGKGEKVYCKSVFTLGYERNMVSKPSCRNAHCNNQATITTW